MIKGSIFFLLFSLIISPSTVHAQKQDTTFLWADKLLLDEVTYPVVRRIEGETNLLAKSLPAINRLTEAYLLLAHDAQAEALLDHADSISASGVPVEKAYLALNASRYYYDVSDYPSSIEQGTAALKILNSLPAPSSFVQILKIKTRLQLGKSFIYSRKLAEARNELDAAVVFFKKDSSRYSIKLAQSYFTSGLWYKISNRFPEAIKDYRKAIHLFEASQHDRYTDLGKVFNNLATAYSENGDYTHAKIFYLKALNIKQQHTTDSLSLSITYNNLGKFYDDFGNGMKARDCYRRSISLLNEKDPRHRERMPELLNNYGSILFEDDEFSEAEVSFRKSIDLLKGRTDERGKVLAPMISLAGLMTLKNELGEAAILLSQAQIILQDSTASARMIALWYLAKANLENAADNNTSAEKYFHQALKHAPANSLLVAEIYIGLGSTQSKKKEPTDALASFKSGYNITEGIGAQTNESSLIALNDIGSTFIDLNKFDSAIYYLNLAVERNNTSHPQDKSARLDAIYPFELISSFYHLSRTHHKLYKNNHRQEDLDKSVAFVDLGLRAIDYNRKALAVTNDRLVFNERVSEFFERAMEAYFEQQEAGKANAEKIFYISELSKSQSLGQTMKQSNLKSFSNVPATLKNEEDKLRWEVQGLDLQTLKELKDGAPADSELLKEYSQELAQANKNYQRLQDSIRDNLPGYFQLKYNKTLVTIADIKQDLLHEKPKAALIQFSVGDSAIYCQVISMEGQKFYKITQAAEVKKRILALRNQVKNGMKDELNQNAAWLYDVLLKPAESVLLDGRDQINQLLIVPDQILCYLPFETLLAGKRRKFLVEDYEISYGYSSSLLWQKYVEKPIASQSHAFVGFAPLFTAEDKAANVSNRDKSASPADRFEFLPLTGNLAEVKTISQGMVKNKYMTTVLEGRDATEASLRKLNLKQYDYVHFATHGFVDMDDPQYSGVALSRNSPSHSFDDLLFTNEVYDMQFNAQLVCLSSCESGIGKIFRGEGMIGLSQAFLYAGARNLAVSLWKVDDLATSELMIDFYKNIPSGDYSKALSLAKRKMLASKKYSHPFYWSSFILIGI